MRRPTKLQQKILNQYIWHRQTLKDLADQHQRSQKWVQHKLDQTDVRPTVKITTQSIIAVADTTFFSRLNGLIVFRDPNLKKSLWWKSVSCEKAEIYLSGKNRLEEAGFAIKAVVLDGRPGIREVFEGIPVQMCHFHQKQIIKRYLTSYPKLPAGQELRMITKTLTETDCQTFTNELNMWHEKWESFLKQKTTDTETGRWFYTHKRIRSAYRSLKTNLPYLFTYQKYPELNIPNTTNSLDGFFSRLKGLLNVHRGLSPARRRRMATEILNQNT